MEVHGSSRPREEYPVRKEKLAALHENMVYGSPPLRTADKRSKDGNEAASLSLLHSAVTHRREKLFFCDA